MKKIEIDLEDILGGDSGSESLQDSIQRQVIESVTKSVSEGIKYRIDKAVQDTITVKLNSYLTQELPALFATIMDTEYQPVSTYGDKKPPTSLRKELLKTVTENMVYKRTQYDSERNTFTRAVDSIMKEQMDAFQKDFNKTVDSTFTAAAFEYARQAVQKKLGI